MNTHPQLQIMQTYLFRFASEPEQATCQLVSLGWQKPTDSYHWDNMARRRSDPKSYCFQYTLSGKGILETEGERYSLGKKQAFFIEIPGPHTYYLPDDSSHWEFIYVQLLGPEAERTCRILRESGGITLSFPPESEPVVFLWDMLRQTQEGRVTNGYIGSKLAYGFLMELQSYIQSPSDSNSFPLPIRAAAEYIAAHYSEVIGIQDIAHVAGLSKFHFARVFQKSTGMPPLQYLTTFRIKRAAELLNTTLLPVFEIARMVGYPNCNYFCKLFKTIVGCTPLQFREEPADQVIFNR